MRRCRQSGSARLLALLTAISALTGCLVIPTPEFSEIRNARLEFIEPGITTRLQLESGLLSDDVFVARVSNPYVIYGESRTAPFQIISEGTTGFLEDVDDYLVVEYDADNRVVSYERLRREGGCTSYGLCVRGVKSRITDPLIVYAPTEADEEAKEFRATGGACSVYLYAEGGAPCNNNGADISMSAAGNPSSPSSRARPDGFFHWLIRDSNRSPQMSVLAMNGNDIIATHQTDCSDGEIVVVALELDGCFINRPQGQFFIRSLEEAEPEILSRRLLLE